MIDFFGFLADVQKAINTLLLSNKAAVVKVLPNYYPFTSFTRGLF